MKKVAVLQSNYIPWKGYFDIINEVDLFIFYDDVQYTKNDWRNRNKVKSVSGSQWLTIPVSSSIDQLIYEVGFQNSMWGIKHFKTLSALYSRAPFFKLYKPFLEDIYLNRQWKSLSEFNQFTIKFISTEILGITTKFKDSREFNCTGNKLDRLLDLLTKAEAELYVSGPAAQDYIDSSRFESQNIELVYMDYSNYKEYDQLYPPFDHYVTILDLLFHLGPDSAEYIWGWRK